MKYIMSLVMAGALTSGNFLWAACVSNDYNKFIERSFFQFIACMVTGIMVGKCYESEK